MWPDGKRCAVGLSFDFDAETIWFRTYAASRDGVWFATHLAIAQAWRAAHPSPV
jgi:hypothetical protein